MISQNEEEKGQMQKPLLTNEIHTVYNRKSNKYQAKQ